MGVWSRQGVWRFCEVEEGRICSVDPDQIHQYDYAFTRLGRLFPCCASLSLLFPKKIFFFVSPWAFSLPSSAWRRTVMNFPPSPLPLVKCQTQLGHTNNLSPKIPD